MPETRHVVHLGFKTFWEATGEAAYLGNPLSEEYKLDGTVYQLFERGLLRWPKDKKVRMAPVGEDLAKRRKLETEPVAPGDLPTYAEASSPRRRPPRRATRRDSSPSWTRRPSGGSRST